MQALLLFYHKFKYLVFLIIIFVAFCLNAKNDSSSSGLIILRRNDITVGILPEIGGRVVLLKKGDNKNIFKVDESLWDDSNKPEISHLGKFKDYYGHSVWLGPQSKWWTQQKLNKKRLKSKSNWPPDPYLIFAKYNILKQNATSITLISPPSPVSGIQLTKTIKIKKDSSVIFQVTAKNIRKSSVSWNIWMISRLSASKSVCFVPVTNASQIKIKQLSKNEPDKLRSGIYKNYFHFIPAKPEAKNEIRGAKAFINPAKGFIAAFSEEQLLLIKFKIYSKNKIHSEHALVEIFCRTAHDSIYDIIELEYHSPFKTLLPGESISSEETWQLYDYRNNNNFKDNIKFLKSIPQL